ncbi:LOW QUALITY PROTEIN: THAP domain-containing protein 2-like [Alosa alosa]|uniref:LOW QUALITY PROTEIN: THAP domain-containing protein 2-like n=1 Tax=Alosa alosa TaxID=278164 RepID=UPI0020153CFC|nr:LOW QUALITY PROTEIN: THAP domain-containing protein 2-like [Alosa alosa]
MSPWASKHTSTPPPSWSGDLKRQISFPALESALKMPDFCASYGCSNERNKKKKKQQGITFHRFPKDKQRRQSWAIALRREGFEPKDRTVLCSCHFRPEDFDKSGQTVRLRQGAIPSIFKFPDRLSKVCYSICFNHNILLRNIFQDHQYALDPVKAKEKLIVYQKNVEKLRRDLRNAKDRERRQKKTVSSLLEDLKKNKMLTEELEQKLDFYFDLPVELFRHDRAFTPAQQEFALTLHLHGPKAYIYLKETMKIPLPHPHTLLKWLQTVDAKPGLNTSLLDMLQRRKNEDPVRYGQVCLVLDGMSIRRQVQYDSHKQTMVGFVDLGSGIDE